MFKRILALVLACSLVILNVSAATSTPYKNENQPFDQLILKDCTISLFQKGNWIYSITINNNKIEFDACRIDDNETVYQILLNNDDLNLSNISNENYLYEQIAEYGFNNLKTKSKVSNFTTSTIGVRSSGNAKLQNEMKSIHGDPYSGKMLLYKTCYNLRFSVNENLDWALDYRNSIAFDLYTTLGSLATAAAASTLKHFGIAVTAAKVLGPLATIIGVTAAVDTVLQYAGVISQYEGEAVYYRYTLVNGAGPYCTTWKKLEYIGWDVSANTEPAYLQHTGTFYYPDAEDDSYFIDFNRQIEDAYYSYTH